MPVIFICFILFIMWFRVKSNKASKMEQNSKEDFLRREHEANLTRKKDISNLDYIVIPEEDLPFTETNDEEEAMLQDNLRKAMSKKILNLSGISNTDLKLEYGYANLEALSQYDQNFTNLLRCLDKWAGFLYKKGERQRSKQILEYAISIGSDITGTYTTLAQIYLDENEPGKVQPLIDTAKNSSSFMKDSIVSKLTQLIQNYTS